MGQNDQAIEVLRSSDLDKFLLRTGTAFLFLPATSPLRADRRFWIAAADLGLARYWKSTGSWPDFCGREVAIELCKTATTKAMH